MKTIMKLEELKTIGQLDVFLSGTQSVAFAVPMTRMPGTAGFRGN
jgi:hypothetical protein